MKVAEVLFVLSAWIIGTLAEECTGAIVDFYCIFGCCSDPLYVYCCLSNGSSPRSSNDPANILTFRAGIGIIVGAIILILSIIGVCLRRTRYRAVRAQTTCNTVSQGVPARPVTGLNNVAYRSSPPSNMGYAQPQANVGYAQPQPKMGYAEPPPAYS